MKSKETLFSKNNYDMQLEEVLDNKEFNDEAKSLILSVLYKIEESYKLDLKESINNLDSDLKIIVILYYYEDMSIKDISESLNIPQGTIKSRLSRARKKLKEILSINEEVL